MRAHLDHWNHIHLRFNSPNPSGTAKSIEPVSPSIDLDDLWFFIDDENRLVVEPRSSKDFTNISILWRYQTEEGFENLEMQTLFGQWKNKIVSFEQSIENAPSQPNDGVRYVYVVLADTRNGGCIQKGITIDLAEENPRFLES
jgi:uncharacterized protein YneR